MMFIKTA